MKSGYKMWVQALCLMCVCFLGLNTAAVGQTPPAGMVLISGTKFESPANAAKNYCALNEIEFLGLVKPSFTTSSKMVLTPDAAPGSFKGGSFYAVTNNPTKLGTAADNFYDNNDAYWGLVVNKQTEDYMFTFTAPGVKTSAAARVVVEYCIPVKTKKDVSVGMDGTARFTVAVSGAQDSYNIMNGANCQLDYNNSTGGTCQTLTVDLTAAQVAASGGTLTVYFNAKDVTRPMLIKSIYIYGSIDPKVTGPLEACSGGENAIISVANTYEGENSYQWYKAASATGAGTAISGATGSSIKHTTNTTGTATSYYYYTITPKGGSAIKSEVFTIKDIICCSDPNTGKPTSRKLIWQEDFGTYTNAKSYWVWDYTDITNPKKVKKTSADQWRRETTSCIPSYTLTNAKYVSTGDVSEQGTQSGYAIIANIAQGVNGLNWAAKAGNGTQWTTANYFPDHTYPDREAYGACLMINCSGTPGEELYKRTIIGLCEKKLTIKCFINNFSDGSTPVQVTINAKDLAPGGATATATASRSAKNDGLAWKEVTLDLTIKPGSPGVEFSVVSSQSGANNGNDLLLDDIQIYACSAPGVEAYFNLTSYPTTIKTCDGSDVTIHADQTTMLESYYGASNLGYIFQYTFSDPNDLDFDKSTWTTINTTPQTSVSKNGLASIFSTFKSQFTNPTGKKMYFRVVAGDKSFLSTFISSGKVFNADDPCSNYSVSAAIEAEIDCPQCTEPKQIAITATGGTLSGTGSTRTVTLCDGESVTLATNDITGTTTPTYKDYSITWYRDSKTSAVGTTNTTYSNPTNGVQSAIVVGYSSVTSSGSTYYVKVVDKTFPNVSTCEKWDEIIVRQAPKPVAQTIPNKTYCAGEMSDVLTFISSPLGAVFDWTNS
ncbi:MAG: hypothetical protein LBU90_09395, partial [Bacteroidales bacterium]|nr:hypothetical protein [Bacteroidales bacterium]